MLDEMLDNAAVFLLQDLEPDPGMTGTTPDPGMTGTSSEPDPGMTGTRRHLRWETRAGLAGYERSYFI